MIEEKYRTLQEIALPPLSMVLVHAKRAVESRLEKTESRRSAEDQDNPRITDVMKIIEFIKTKN